MEYDMMDFDAFFKDGAIDREAIDSFVKSGLESFREKLANTATIEGLEHIKGMYASSLGPQIKQEASLQEVKTIADLYLVMPSLFYRAIEEEIQNRQGFK